MIPLTAMNMLALVAIVVGLFNAFVLGLAVLYLLNGRDEVKRK